MSSAPPGKRVWNCPDCGGEVLLSITQLDPLACPDCVAKLKGGSSSTRPGAIGTAGGPLQIVMSQPESVKLAGVGTVALLLGLMIGFVAGRVTAPEQSAAPSRHTASPDASSSRDASRSTSRSNEHDAEEEPVVDDDHPDESTRPGPGYKWVKSYKKKDGSKVKAHWARDSNARK